MLLEVTVEGVQEELDRILGPDRQEEGARQAVAPEVVAPVEAWAAGVALKLVMMGELVGEVTTGEEVQAMVVAVALEDQATRLEALLQIHKATKAATVSLP